jgi:hypothetical protein
MGLGCTARLRLRRPAAVLVAGLIALQALLAGLAAAQAAIVLTASQAEVAVICHGHGGGDADHGSNPDPRGAAHLCCVACACGGAPATLAQAAPLLGAVAFRSLRSVPGRAAAGPMRRRVVRDGPSQAPPTLA